MLEPDTALDDEALCARARTLGLDRTDLVVRRMLVQKMRLLAARTGANPTHSPFRDWPTNSRGCVDHRAHASAGGW